MKHRHNGPPVRYRTRRGRVMARKRPLHPLTLNRKREGRKGIRHSSFSDRERHSDNIFRLQQEHRNLVEDKNEIENKMESALRQMIMEKHIGIGDLSLKMLNKPAEELTNEERFDIYSSLEETKLDKEYQELIEEEIEILEQIDNKLIAIKEERDFLEE